MPAQNEKKDHLPVLGVGPYVIAITVLTVACVTLSKLGFLRIFAFEQQSARYAIKYSLWCEASGFGFPLPSKKNFAKIIANQLVTTGVYALVRNPIYSICVCHVRCSTAL